MLCNTGNAFSSSSHYPRTSLKVEARLQSRKPAKDFWFVPLEASSLLMTAGAAAATAPLEPLISLVSVASLSMAWPLQQETETQQEADKGIRLLGGRVFRENPAHRQKCCNPPLLENRQLGGAYAGRAEAEFKTWGSSCPRCARLSSVFRGREASIFRRAASRVKQTLTFGRI